MPLAVICTGIRKRNIMVLFFLILAILIIGFMLVLIVIYAVDTKNYTVAFILLIVCFICVRSLI